VIVRAVEEQIESELVRAVVVAGLEDVPDAARRRYSSVGSLRFPWVELQSPILAGGRRSAWSLTGSSRRSLCC
jgi:hypothetical protein